MGLYAWGNEHDILLNVEVDYEPLWTDKSKKHGKDI
jgi:hypothetical protein